MKGFEYIKSKQQNWADRKGFVRVGSTIDGRGEKNYLKEINDNLFQPITDITKQQYNSGDGNETTDTDKNLAKMKALHSSAAIVVNLFQYWQNRQDINNLAYACGLCRKSNQSANKIVFEEKLPILPQKESKTMPNIDIVVRNTDKTCYAIESKFTEPYQGRELSGMSEKYFNSKNIWKGIPETKKLAEEIKPNDAKYKVLHAAQLIKHILGLKKKYGKSGFRLLYLWYDVIGIEGVEHRMEIEQFAKTVKKDGIKFSHITYQEVIAKLSREFYDENKNYVDYLTDRYL
jgi:hypothetical protein